jgi:filamentous hemagglutinin family protein
MQMHNFFDSFPDRLIHLTLSKTSQLLEKKWLYLTRKHFLKRHLGLAFTICVSYLLASSKNLAVAQLIPDSTLGAGASTVTPITPTTDQIDNGATRGTNLFHSFQEFNVGNGRAVYFTNPVGIQNILTRVTGTNPSNILGTLGVSGGNANLFLINPNGIIFGSNASLDLNGSFVATTANAIAFGSQGFFSASAPNVPPVLTINPSAFFFNQRVAQPITINSQRMVGPVPEPIDPDPSDSIFLLAPIPAYQGLKVSNNQSLLFLGGSVSVDGGRLEAPGGRVELGSVAGAGTVGLSVNGSELRLSFPLDVARADVSLSNGALVDVRAGGGGSIAIHARSLTMTGESKLRAGIASGSGSAGSQAGDIEINAKEEINLTNASSIFNSVGGEAIGNGGSITLKSNSLVLSNEAQVGTTTLGQGNAGSVVIQADDYISLAGRRTGIFSSVEFGVPEDLIDLPDNDIGLLTSGESTGVGDSGGVTIRARTLFLADGAQIISSTVGQGNAGRISVRADDAVSLIGKDTTIFSTVETVGPFGAARGNSGGITINASSIFLSQGAQLSASTSGEGNAGSVFLRARDQVSLSGQDTAILSLVNPSAVGDSGGIAIQARTLSLTNGAQLVASTFGQGNAGTLSMQVNDSVSVIGGPTNISLFTTPSVPKTVSRFPYLAANFRESGATTGIFSTVESKAGGTAGNIQIQTRSLTLTNGAEVQSLTRGEGKAGNIIVNASDSVNLSGVAAPSLIDLPIPIIIDNPQGDLQVIDTLLAGGFSSGLISATEEGAIGQGGDIFLTTGALRLSDGAVLNARTRNNFRGGDITVNANTLELNQGGQLLVSAFGSGNAGNISVNAASGVTLSGSDLTYSDRLAQFGQDRVDNVSPSSGLFANTFANSAGRGGNLELRTGQLNVRDGAEVNVSSEGLGNAGELRIQANSIFLSDQGKLRASTVSGEGGNISLQVQDLILMRRHSSISAEAGGTGNGGNISINSPFIVALPQENSDIIANAVKGRGGNINITTQGIYGIEYRPQLTPLSDINASSQFGINGTVQINTPGVDPTRGLTNLPTEVVDASNQIAQNCPSDGRQVDQNEFIVTGRGGLPDNPSEMLNADAVWTDLRPIANSAENRVSLEATAPPHPPTAAPLVEANGWVINPKGQVVLTATAPTVTPHSSWQKPVTCRRS